MKKQKEKKGYSVKGIMDEQEYNNSAKRRRMVD